MVCHGGTTAFTYQSRVGYFFLPANFGHGADYVPCVFCEGVIHGTFRIASGSVIVNGQTAPDIEIGGLKAEMVKLGVEACRLAHGPAEGKDIRNLRAYVEVEHLQGLGASLFAQILNGFKKFTGR